MKLPGSCPRVRYSVLMLHQGKDSTATTLSNTQQTSHLVPSKTHPITSSSPRFPLRVLSCSSAPRTAWKPIANPPSCIISTKHKKRPLFSRHFLVALASNELAQCPRCPRSTCSVRVSVGSPLFLRIATRNEQFKTTSPQLNLPPCAPPDPRPAPRGPATDPPLSFSGAHSPLPFSLSSNRFSFECPAPVIVGAAPRGGGHGRVGGPRRS